MNRKSWASNCIAIPQYFQATYFNLIFMFFLNKSILDEEAGLLACGTKTVNILDARLAMYPPLHLQRSPCLEFLGVFLITSTSLLFKKNGFILTFECHINYVTFLTQHHFWNLLWSERKVHQAITNSYVGDILMFSLIPVLYYQVQISPPSNGLQWIVTYILKKKNPDLGCVPGNRV